MTREADLVEIPRSARAALRRAIRAHMTDLRERARHEKADALDPARLKQLLFLDPRKGHLDGDCVDRMVFFLRGSGCSWVSQAGGCTFCGFWDATNFGEKISDEDYLQQVDGALATLGDDVAKYPILCVYNDGSLLDDTEMGQEALLAILRRLSGLPSVRRVVIEAKVSDLRDSLLPALREATGPKELEIAVGFESANPDVRDLCINKTLNNHHFAAKADSLRRAGISLVPLVMVKPPFLTESQAIHDVVETLRFLEPLELRRVDLEMATVEEHTLVNDLWRHGLYQTPRLWSILEIVKRSRAIGLKTPLFISPPNYTVPSLDYTENCPACTRRVVRSIEAYNRRFDPAALAAEDCACRAGWAELLTQPSDTPDLEAQVRRTFDRLLARKTPSPTP